MGTTIETRISGIPCIVEITSYYPSTPMKWFRDGTCLPPQYEELEFSVMDRKVVLLGLKESWMTKIDQELKKNYENK